MEKGKEAERRKGREKICERMEWYIGTEEDNVQKETKVLHLLPGRKYFFEP